MSNCCSNLGLSPFKFLQDLGRRFGGRWFFPVRFSTSPRSTPETLNMLQRPINIGDCRIGSYRYSSILKKGGDGLIRILSPVLQIANQPILFKSSSHLRFSARVARQVQCGSVKRRRAKFGWQWRISWATSPVNKGFQLPASGLGCEASAHNVEAPHHTSFHLSQPLLLR